MSCLGDEPSQYRFQMLIFGLSFVEMIPTMVCRAPLRPSQYVQVLII